ncbi:MAG TPA: hypothetical protein VLF60_04975 [Candidatus Saccharimonadales bacterium]|nr:hypothetical protein [Candidatus Saccharimonadales bacterium]
MSRPECLSLCPRITVCREVLFVEMQTPSPTGEAAAAAKSDALIKAVAEVALADCNGPQVEPRTIKKGGYFQSKKPETKEVFVCGDNGYVQTMAFYYQRDKMPGQGE